MSMLLALGLANAAGAADVRLISVVGMAEKSFKPDMAVVHLSIWGKGPSAKKAQEVNQKYFETFKKSLEKFQIKEEDVMTSQYSLNPDYNYDQATKKNILTSYQANQSLSITIKNVAEIGNFIDSLSDDKKVTDGGINLNSLNFDVAKRKEEEQKLLTDAVKSAQEKAEILARAAKVKIKGIHRLSPQQSGGGGPVYMRSDMMMAKSGGTEVMGGEVKIVSEVSAEFIID